MSRFSPKRCFVSKFAALLALTTLALGSCTFATILRYGPSGVEDYAIFPHRTLKAGRQPYRFPNGPRLNSPTVPYHAFGEHDLDSLLAANDTLAFLVLKNDRLVYERYFNGHGEDKLSQIFSVSKSVLSMLIGCALDDGLIRSIQQPVTDFVPELRTLGYDAVTLEHLLQMTSGMDYLEWDNPFGLHPAFYYGDDLEKRLLAIPLANPPGTRWSYKSGENELLGLILARSLHGRTITDYMQEKLWEPLGMEFDGQWAVDHEPDGLEKTFCCLALRPRDALKLGRLMLHNGEWEGRRILSEAWVARSHQVDIRNGSAWFYQNQWWVGDLAGNDYYAMGHLGQIIYVNPGKDVVIVRLGSDRGRFSDRVSWIALLRAVAQSF